MTEIAVYIEGGGNTSGQKAELRQGFDALFRSEKEKARDKRGSLRLVCCGGRQETYEAFMNEQAVNPAAVCALLVDSETPVAPVSQNREEDAVLRRNHLAQKQGTAERGQGDGWQLTDVSPDRVHLMVQCMEAWIIADPEALGQFYRQGFRKARLPRRNNLEEESKTDVCVKLEGATEDTQKGKYAKIRHASKLLLLLNPDKVARRCPRFAIFRDWLNERIDAAPDAAR
ncbi:MAG: DUF4276 family protein [Terracidiphilus sp.]